MSALGNKLSGVSEYRARRLRLICDARLLRCAAAGKVWGVRGALRRGAGAHACDEQDRDAADLALAGGHEEAARAAMAAQNGQWARRKGSALASAAAGGLTGLCAEFAERLGMDPAAKDPWGREPLALACFGGHWETAVWLAQRTGGWGREGTYPPLAAACLGAGAEFVEKLAAMGGAAQWEKQSADILFCAMRSKKDPARKALALLRAGADPEGEGIWGGSALQRLLLEGLPQRAGLFLDLLEPALALRCAQAALSKLSTGDGTLEKRAAEKARSLAAAAELRVLGPLMEQSAGQGAARKACRGL